MKEGTHYTEAELLNQIAILKQTILEQNHTIQRLMEAYVYNTRRINRKLISVDEEE